jgi:hypothetical protein
MKNELLAVAESLQKKSRAVIVDNLIATLWWLNKKRFRKQYSQFKAEAGVALQASINAGDITASLKRTIYELGDVEVFRADEKFEAVLDQAWTGGAGIGAAEGKGDIEAAAKLSRTYHRPAESFLSEIDRTTRDQVTSVIKRGIEEGLSRGALQRAVGELFRSWTETGGRAERSAVWEVSKAFHAGMLAAAPRGSFKSWQTEEGACEICVENEDAGPIPINEQFPSGDDAAPAHLLCRCSTEIEPAED